MAEVADIVTKVQAGEKPSADEYAALQTAVENTEVPVNVRVRALPVLAEHTEVNQTLLTKTVQAMVKMLDDDLVVVHTAVVKALTDLCVSAGKFLEAAKTSDLVRDVVDILFQVSLARSGFAQEVRKLAHESVFKTLPAVSALGVAVKAAHLLSNERWNDTQEQLDAERRGALDLIGALTSPGKKELWDEESEAKLLKVVAHLFGMVSASEMGRLLTSLGKLPNMQAKEGAPIVEAVLKLTKVDSPRTLETIGKLRNCMPREAVNDAIIDKLAPLLAKAKSADPAATQVAKTFVFAARHASAEAAAKHIVTVRKALEKNGKESWTYTEALLTALAVLGGKAADAMGEMLNDDEFRKMVYGLAEEASALELKLSFATQKLALNKEATGKHAEAIDCLKNVVRIGAFVEVKKTPELKPGSWEARHAPPKAPAQKRVDLDKSLDQAKKPQPKPKH